MSPPPATAFSWEPLFLVLAAAAVVLYARAARAEPVGRWRTASFGVGVFLVAAAVNSPLETLAAHYLLVMHLFQNVVVADWAPVFLLLGLTPRMREALARRGGDVWATLTRPRVALPVWVAGWYVIHFAGFYDLALAHQWLLNVEHAVLLAMGILFWWPLISGRLSPPFAIGYLGAAFIGSAFLGLGLTFARTPFYDFYTDVPRIWGLTAVQDQNFGGVLMGAEQAVVFLVAIGWFLGRLLREEDDTSVSVRP